MVRAAPVKLDYNTTAFEKELVDFAGEPEYIVKGGRDKFSGLPKAFEGVKEVRINHKVCSQSISFTVVLLHRCYNRALSPRAAVLCEGRSTDRDG
jgi:hypothetical protein